MHTSDLKPGKTITVNLDYKQMGVGGDDSWGARTHPEYTLPAKPYSYRFLIRPYTTKMGPAQAVAGEGPASTRSSASRAPGAVSVSANGTG